jgi:hypothetical protein
VIKGSSTLRCLYLGRSSLRTEISYASLKI